jgi:hypothetical protein
VIRRRPPSSRQRPRRPGETRTGDEPDADAEGQVSIRAPSENAKLRVAVIGTPLAGLGRRSSIVRPDVSQVLPLDGSPGPYAARLLNWRQRSAASRRSSVGPRVRDARLNDAQARSRRTAGGAGGASPGPSLPRRAAPSSKGDERRHPRRGWDPDRADPALTSPPRDAIYREAAASNAPRTSTRGTCPGVTGTTAPEERAASSGCAGDGIPSRRPGTRSSLSAIRVAAEY